MKTVRDLAYGVLIGAALTVANLVLALMLGGCDGKSSYSFTHIVSPTDTVFVEPPPTPTCGDLLRLCMKEEDKRHDLHLRFCKQLPKQEAKACAKAEGRRHKIERLACQGAFKVCEAASP